MSDDESQAKFEALILGPQMDKPIGDLIEKLSGGEQKSADYVRAVEETRRSASEP